MKSFFRCLVFLLFGVPLLPSQAQGRLIQLTQSGFGSYLSYYGGTSLLSSNAFSNETNSSLTYSEAHALNYGGEFGFLYNTGRVAYRFGFEILKPNKLTGVLVKDTNQTVLYTASSDITGYAPKLSIEIGLRSRPDSKWNLLLFGGNASLTVKNDYALTADGQAAFSAVADHSVDYRGTAALYGGGLSYEFLFNDSTTFLFDLGYRFLNFTHLTYGAATTTFSGAKAQGDVVLDSNGLPKSLEFSSIYLNFGFRIYMY